MQAEFPVEAGFFKWRIGLFLLLAASVVGALVYEFSDPYTSLSRRLPDGSTLRIVVDSYANSNYYAGSQAKPWQLAIGRKLPFSLASRLDWWFGEDNWFYVASPPGYSNFLLVAVCDGVGKRKAAKSYRAVLFDAASNGLSCRASGGGAGDDFARSELRGNALPFSEDYGVSYYPRRDKKIILRFFEDQTNGKAPKVVAEFHLPNPYPGPYPTWTPSPLPTTETAGNINVTLVDFVTGMSRAHPETAARGNEDSVTRVALRLEQPGQTNCPWMPLGLEMSDATGNRWPPNAGEPKRDTNGLYNMNFSDPLYAGESAWKVKVEITRTNGFESNELWSASGIPVPGQSTPSAYSTNIDGCAFSINLSISQKSRRSSTSRFIGTTLSLTSTNIPKDARVTLVSATDDQGAAIKIKSHSTAGKKEYYEVAIPLDAKRLDCVCAYHKSRFVEFVAVPRRE